MADAVPPVGSAGSAGSDVISPAIPPAMPPPKVGAAQSSSFPAWSGVSSGPAKNPAPTAMCLSVAKQTGAGSGTGDSSKRLSSHSHNSRRPGSRPISISTRSRSNHARTPSRRSWASTRTRMSVTMPNGAPIDASDWSLCSILREEVHLIVGFASATFFMIWGDHHTMETLSTGMFAVCFIWIFCVMLWLAFAVVRHADCLAVKLGEPYGTLILTVSVISIEIIMMAALMITGDEKTLARDTMFSVVMIVLNGMLGLTLVVGGIRHSQQAYNLQSSQAFLNVLLPLAILGLVIPRYSQSADGGEVSTQHSVFLVLMSIVLYGIFLVVQTMYHPDFFKHEHFDEEQAPLLPPDGNDRDSTALQDLGASGNSRRWGSDSMYFPTQDETSPPLSPPNADRSLERDSFNMLTSELVRLRGAHGRISVRLSQLTRQLAMARGHGSWPALDQSPSADDLEAQHDRDDQDDFIRPVADDADPPHGGDHDEHAGLVLRSTRFHAAFLLLSMAPISMLAEKLAILVERIVSDVGAPHALAGFLVATLVLSPECMGAVRAALANRIQRTVNIALGSALSTIGLTIPAVLVIGLITGKDVELGLDTLGIAELMLTLLVTITTFIGGRTNVLQGAVHLILFFSFVLLIFDRKSDDHSPSAVPLAPPTAP